MLRALWFGLVVAITPMTACSKDTATPAVAAHEPVGKVVAISGKVEAIRGGQTRVLAMDAPVFGDDEVIVGADGSVGIDLAHNNARWTLEAGRRGKIRESVAWTMAKVDTPAKPVEHATSAAGREGERNAATSATTETGTARAEPITAAGSAAVDDRPKEVTVTKPVKPTTKDLGGLTGTGPGGGGVGQSYGAGAGRLGADRKGVGAPNPKLEREPAGDVPPPPPPPPPPAEEEDKRVSMDKDKEGPSDPDAVKRQEAIRKVILAQKATLLSCPGAAGLKLDITVVRSVAKVAIVGGKTADPAATLKCMETKLQQLKLARAEQFVVRLEL